MAERPPDVVVDTRLLREPRLCLLCTASCSNTSFANTTVARRGKNIASRWRPAEQFMHCIPRAGSLQVSVAH